jgi:DNA repair protein RecO (recombination protein O)
MHKDYAILIRRTRLTETSLIIHFCTATQGIIKTVAKGALRPKSPFRGKLDLFFATEIEFIRSRKSDLHTLKELAVTNSRLGIRRRYSRTLAASYFVQLIEIVCERDTPINDLYDLLKRGLDFLDANDPDSRAILHFERELARAIGVEKGGPSPIEAIRALFHRIPGTRTELLEMMNMKGP